MAETHHINGHDRRSHAERIAHLTGGRLADGIAISFTPPQRIGIGRFTMHGLPPALGGPAPVTIVATARPQSDTATVWLNRTTPAPHRAIGYTMWAHAPGAHYQSYIPDLPETTETALCERAAALWARAQRRGRVTARRTPGLIRLALKLIEGLRIDLTWETGGDAVALAFRDLEPEHLGTVTGLDSDTPRLYPTPAHMDWATEPGRPARLITAATDAYHQRPEPRKG